jgi:transcriptional regulator with XRE-family HTH domain
MGLREIRKSRNMSQSELANMCSINYRSLQDYEQGQKKLLSANGDILLRLTTVLGCTLSELLMSDQISGATLHEKNQVDTATIQNQQFYC